MAFQIGTASDDNDVAFDQEMDNFSDSDVGSLNSMTTENILSWNPDAPEYKPLDWNKDNLGVDLSRHNRTDTNCYEYAVSGFGPTRDANIANPGEVVGNFSIVTALKKDLPTYKDDEEIISLAEQDGLQKAGISGYSELIPPAKTGYYLTAMYTTPDAWDYHLIRQDKFGGWSEKFGSNGEVRKIEAGDIAPYDTATLAPPTLGSGYYRFAQYFYVPKEGLNVGSDAWINNLARDNRPGDVVSAYQTSISGRRGGIIPTLWSSLSPQSKAIIGEPFALKSLDPYKTRIRPIGENIRSTMSEFRFFPR